MVLGCFGWFPVHGRPARNDSNNGSKNNQIQPHVCTHIYVYIYICKNKNVCKSMYTPQKYLGAYRVTCETLKCYVTRDVSLPSYRCWQDSRKNKQTEGTLKNEKTNEYQPQDPTKKHIVLQLRCTSWDSRNCQLIACTAFAANPEVKSNKFEGTEV